MKGENRPSNHPDTLSRPVEDRTRSGFKLPAANSRSGPSEGFVASGLFLLRWRCLRPSAGALRIDCKKQVKLRKGAKGAKREPKVSQLSQKGTKNGANGAKSEPKGSQKWSQIQVFYFKEPQKGSHKGPKCALRIDFVSKSDGKKAC